MSFLGVGTVNRFRCMSQSNLGKSLRVARRLGPLCPRIAIAMQRNSLHFGSAAHAGKLRRAISLTHPREIWKERPFLWQGAKQRFEFGAEMNDLDRLGIHS